MSAPILMAEDHLESGHHALRLQEWPCRQEALRLFPPKEVVS